MRKYETMFVIRPDLDEEGTKAVIEKFVNLLKDQGAEIESVEEWGMRKLAYEVNKVREGYYVLIYFEAESGAVQELERIFRISADIVRSIVVNQTELAG